VKTEQLKTGRLQGVEKEGGEEGVVVRGTRKLQEVEDCGRGRGRGGGG